MKHLSKVLIALLLAVLTATILPAQVFADSAPKYISEIKLGEGKTITEAQQGLSGYEIVNDKSTYYYNVNELAVGDDKNSKGDRVVLIGYKTTNKREEAITDIALMNMKGGFSVRDYEKLLEDHYTEQIEPFILNFSSALEEYRINYKSGSASNKARAVYVKELLNKLIDDDTGKPLGDLLLNQTKQEMGDAYDALPDEKKKEHADLGTILMQANGNVTLVIENAVTRAADTGDDTWLDRFLAKDYDDLIDETELSASKAKKELDRLYSDSALTVLNMLEEFLSYLEGYAEAKAFMASFDEKSVNSAIEAYENMTGSESSGERDRITEEYNEAMDKYVEALTSAEKVAIYEYLEKTEYEGETLLDFFTQPSENFEDDLTLLYPIVAALSAGQKAGLEFISLKELIAIALADVSSYDTKSIKELETVSVYAGVNREFYEKGAVALTSEALRKNTMENPVEDNDTTVKALFYAAMAMGALAVVSLVGFGYAAMRLHFYIEAVDEGMLAAGENALSIAFRASSICKGLLNAVPLLSLVAFGILIYFSYDHMGDKYNVKFDSIPRYMVDEKDITAYNAKGEKIVVKNQEAYYKAALCNRPESHEMYGTIGNIGDINGTVCKQWVALYYSKNSSEAPILANSLTCVKGSETIPAGYTTGIHMFGTSAAENLNNTLYVWNSSAPKIFVYYKTEDAGASAGTAGSNFTAGIAALSGVCGLAVGAIAVTLGMKSAGKRKKNTAESV